MELGFGDFIAGLVMVVIGFLMLKETLWFVNNFGRIPWFEAHLQSFGGTFLFYKVIGILFCFLGILSMTGLLEPFTTWLLGSLFGNVFDPNDQF